MTESGIIKTIKNDKNKNKLKAIQTAIIISQLQEVKDEYLQWNGTHERLANQIERELQEIRVLESNENGTGLHRPKSSEAIQNHYF